MGQIETPFVKLVYFVNFAILKVGKWPGPALRLPWVLLAPRLLTAVTKEAGDQLLPIRLCGPKDQAT